ncbi:hypothetical protein ASF30_09730 [Leifsonia sp. Leaf264]|nr:hypothetical protein ASF30_09730 [Leifsonia sp. Leaf264]
MVLVAGLVVFVIATAVTLWYITLPALALGIYLLVLRGRRRKAKRDKRVIELASRIEHFKTPTPAYTALVEALWAIADTDEAPTSTLLQRRVGYSKVSADQALDLFEWAGIISPRVDNRRRTVIVDRSELWDAAVQLRSTAALTDAEN